MRYIDIRRIQVTPVWEQAAKDALDAARKASIGAERSKSINANQAVWSGLKEDLRNLSSGKCWYCEARDSRSDNAVDHYRPKGNVKGSIPEHGGYWWLAFDSKNYRFSCTFCNSQRKSKTTVGGKQDYFPLWKEDRRAKDEGSDLADELPLLLDPTNVLDVKLISFSEDGGVGPSYAADDAEHAMEYAMATVSIERYHLHHPHLVERRMHVLRQVKAWVEEADQHLDRYGRSGDAYSRNVAKDRVADVVRAAAVDAEFSVAVRHLIIALATKSRAAASLKDAL